MAAEINHIGGIKKLDVNFTDDMNIICGPNGIGKSTILESISFLFTRNGSDIKKNIRSSEDGIINLHIELPSGRHNFIGSASTFAPQEQTGNYQQYLNIRYLIRFSTERHFSYSRLEHIGTDPLRVTMMCRYITTEEFYYTT